MEETQRVRNPVLSNPLLSDSVVFYTGLFNVFACVTMVSVVMLYSTCLQQLMNGIKINPYMKIVSLTTIVSLSHQK